MFFVCSRIDIDALSCVLVELSFCTTCNWKICEWNLGKLAEALHPLLPLPTARAILHGSSSASSAPITTGDRGDSTGGSGGGSPGTSAQYRGFLELYKLEYERLLRAKLGLLTARDDDPQLFESLFDSMGGAQTDFTGP